jgi:hypothetical protein
MQCPIRTVTSRVVPGIVGLVVAAALNLDT